MKDLTLLDEQEMDEEIYKLLKEGFEIVEYEEELED